ncbi:hypothetical protein IFT48_18435 [Pseudomonas fluorescens]|uniref:hypothetical protein n=1 Tax=Pseudomonas fluorescens TaxID=294 RepID=UPI0019030FB8|nr:hypothetical protein [Pseudomonas fluorescens]MBD8091977.1 hypothetical protein [Pseudomonas fluorescens]MBD8718266.1 hypothetical protein [Pseudomonas fluorescens]
MIPMIDHYMIDHFNDSFVPHTAQVLQERFNQSCQSAKGLAMMLQQAQYIEQQQIQRAEQQRQQRLAMAQAAQTAQNEARGKRTREYIRTNMPALYSSLQ